MDLGEIVISTATGLPELPEGHFWKVQRKKKYNYSYEVFSYLSGFEVVWMEPNPEGTKRVLKRKHWYSISQSWVTVPDTEPVAKMRATIYTEVQGQRVEAMELRKPEILDAAVCAFEKVYSEEQTLSLLGEYPPKTLN